MREDGDDASVERVPLPCFGSDVVEESIERVPVDGELVIVGDPAVEATDECRQRVRRGELGGMGIARAGPPPGARRGGGVGLERRGGPPVRGGEEAPGGRGPPLPKSGRGAPGFRRPQPGGPAGGGRRALAPGARARVAPPPPRPP